MALGDLSIPPPSGASGGGTKAIAGRYYALPGFGGAISTRSLVQGTMYLYRCEWGGGSVDLAGAVVTTGVASSVLRFGIYADDEGGQPTGSPLLDFGTVEAASGGNKATTAGDAFEPPSVFWLGTVVYGGASGVTVRAKTAEPGPHVGGPDMASTWAINGWTQTGISGALPAIGSLTAETGVIPITLLRGA